MSGKRYSGHDGITWHCQFFRQLSNFRTTEVHIPMNRKYFRQFPDIRVCPEKMAFNGMDAFRPSPVKRIQKNTGHKSCTFRNTEARSFVGINCTHGER